MPEGPEVQRQVDQLTRALRGQPLVDVFLGMPHLQADAVDLVGAQTTAVEAHSKAFVLRFERGPALYVHHQLYGRWVVRRRGPHPKTGRALRVALETERHMALLYSASDVHWYTDAQLAEHPYLRKLGPGLLDPQTTAEVIAQRAQARAFQGRRLATLLLDQGFVAGMGNYLRSEALFEAGLRGDERPRDLDEATLWALGDAVVTVGQRAYAMQGVTVPPELNAQLKAQGQRKAQRRHWVFAREGRPCRRCSTPVERLEAGGRRLYRCPTCQPERGRA